MEQFPFHYRLAHLLWQGKSKANESDVGGLETYESKADEDKRRVCRLYESLDRSKVWALASETIVEDVMKEVAVSLDYEHPCHSLILGLADHCWIRAFEAKDWQEIRHQKAIGMPDMPVEVESYLEQLRGISNNDLYSKAKADIFPMKSNVNCFAEASRLNRSNFFPMTNCTEADLVKRVWSCIDTCFDFSSIKCTSSGGKCSRASADSSNSIRSISDRGRATYPLSDGEEKKPHKKGLQHLH